MIRITILCPEAHVSDANHLAMALGQGPADGLTFGAPGWRNESAAAFAVASLPVSADWLAAAQAPLSRPDWDVASQIIEMAAAARAQARVQLHDPAFEGVVLPPLPLGFDDGERILAVTGEPLDFLARLGLTQILQEGGQDG